MRAGGFASVSICVLATAAACGGDDDGGGGGDGGDGGSADGGGGPDGGGSGGVGLTVHVGSLTSGSVSWVVLGDGALRARLDSTTDAFFPTARLPVDVHHVQAAVDGSLTVRSYLAIDAHEIWVNGAGGPPYTESFEAQVSGTVSSEVEGGGRVAAGGGGVDGMHGESSWSGDTWGISLFGYAESATVDVVAYQASENDRAYRAGAVRGVAIGEAPTTDVAVAVDHDFDRTLDVSVTGDEPYGGQYKAQLIFSLADRIAFFTEDQDVPIQVPTPLMDEPMQAVERYVWVPLGEGDGYDFGPLETARMYLAVEPDAAEMTVAALAPFQLHQPPFAGEVPAELAAGSLEAVTWTADPDANLVEIMVQANDDENAYQEFCWEIFAPAALGRAAVPDLPDEVWDGIFLGPRQYALYLTQWHYPGLESATARWSDPTGQDLRSYRNTRRRSLLRVE